MPFFGGANNLLYRVTGDEDDLAVTFVVMPTTAWQAEIEAKSAAMAHARRRY